ncbi:MAG: hypothetical protein AAGJ80_06800, partial [Cyanobacteria bacterium J06553_1]
NFSFKEKLQNQAIWIIIILVHHNDMPVTFISAHNLSNATLPSYEAPSIQPISLITFCCLIFLMCVFIYGASALQKFYVKHQRENTNGL